MSENRVPRGQTVDLGENAAKDPAGPTEKLDGTPCSLSWINGLLLLILDLAECDDIMNWSAFF
jgi:hypothetical protein